MKNMKKILCLVLVILTAFSMLVISASAASDEYVATITVFSSTSTKNALGHSWVYFENISDETITVGAYPLDPNKGVSVGVFSGKTLADGKGVYYNVESYLIHNVGSGKGRRSTTAKITEAQLQNATNTINSSNTWSVVKNCSAFAEKVWNSACPNKKVWSLGTPSFLRSFLLLRNYRTNMPVYSPAHSECFKQVNSTTMTPCKQGSLTFVF